MDYVRADTIIEVKAGFLRGRHNYRSQGGFPARRVYRTERKAGRLPLVGRGKVYRF